MIDMPLRRLQKLNGFSALALISLMVTSGCTAVGPSRKSVTTAAMQAVNGIQIIDLDERVARGLDAAKPADFSETLGDALPIGSVIQPGDVLEISVWEAPPAVLFGTQALPTSSETSRSTSLPAFLVEPSGRISVPFAGIVQVAGRTLSQIESDITGRLRNKAHLPQVIVRLVRNETATVTVVGEVTNSTRMPLTPKGEHLLDALAAAGGTRQPINKMSIQVSRNGRVHIMPLEAVIRDPRQNIILKTGDVVTALYQPYSFTALGASGKNEEINFEATGLTLAQAVGRIGGLQDGRADAKGVFIFRWEDPVTVPNRGVGAAIGPDGRIPVIYRVDMKNPVTYFAMQHFKIRDRDVLYVSNNPTVEFQRVIGLVASAVFPVLNVTNTLNNRN